MPPFSGRELVVKGREGMAVRMRPHNDILTGGLAVWTPQRAKFWTHMPSTMPARAR